MRSDAVSQRFGILAHVGNGNLGDEATVAALLQSILVRHPDAEVVVFSANPTDTQTRHGVRALAIDRLAAARPARGLRAGPIAPSLPQSSDTGTARLKRRLQRLPWLVRTIKASHRCLRFVLGLGPEFKFLLGSLRALRSVDRLIIAGGGQLGDYFGGPWQYPFATLRWCLMARLAGAHVAFTSVGAEPIRSPISKRFFRWALALADYRSFRDEGSRRLLDGIVASAQCRVFPDLVHGLRTARVERPPAATQTALTIGINPIPFFDSRYWAESDDAVYRRYVDMLASFTIWLIGRGDRVLFLPTQIRADPLVIADIAAAARKALGDVYEHHVIEPHVHNFSDLASALAMVDIVVASRFHGIIFSYLFEKPVVGLSYYRKMEELMADMGQGEYALAIRDADVEGLKARFCLLEKHLDQAKEDIRRRQEEYRRALDVQYSLLLR